MQMHGNMAPHRRENNLNNSFQYLLNTVPRATRNAVASTQVATSVVIVNKLRFLAGGAEVGCGGKRGGVVLGLVLVLVVMRAFVGTLSILVAVVGGRVLRCVTAVLVVRLGHGVRFLHMTGHMSKMTCTRHL
jgi:hypothetical protein